MNNTRSYNQEDDDDEDSMVSGSTSTLAKSKVNLGGPSGGGGGMSALGHSSSGMGDRVSAAGCAIINTQFKVCTVCLFQLLFAYLNYCLPISTTVCLSQQLTQDLHSWTSGRT